MRRALAAALAAALVAGPLAGCGSPSPDLFEVQRSGPDRNANVDLIVDDGGSVTCNGVRHPISASQLLAARQLVRDLQPQAELNLRLPRGPRSELSYRVRMEAGTVAFSDASRGNPPAFLRLAALTKDITEDVCGLRR